MLSSLFLLHNAWGFQKLIPPTNRKVTNTATVGFDSRRRRRRDVRDVEETARSGQCCGSDMSGLAWPIVFTKK
jgi:hypothetical protein